MEWNTKFYNQLNCSSKSSILAFTSGSIVKEISLASSISSRESLMVGCAEWDPEEVSFIRVVIGKWIDLTEGHELLVDQVRVVSATRVRRGGEVSLEKCLWAMDSWKYRGLR